VHRRLLSLRIDFAKSYWIMVVVEVFTRRIIGFGAAATELDGAVICRDVHWRDRKADTPQYLCSDHDPLLRFHRWLANLPILKVDEIKAIPCTLRSHTFVERLIGSVRREYLDRTLFFGTRGILSGSSRITKPITTNTRVTPDWEELGPLNAVSYPHTQSQNLSHMPGGNIALVYFRPHLCLNWNSKRTG